MVFLNKLLKKFRDNENFEPDSETGPLEDAKSITESVDYEIISAAWELYAAIKQQGEEYDADYIRTPAWKALNKLIEFEGDFNHFQPTKEDIILLRALRGGFLVYDDVLHVLIDHHNDTALAEVVFEKHPDLHEHLPKEYNTKQELIHVMIEVVKDYQWQLEHFYNKHKGAIEMAIVDDIHMVRTGVTPDTPHIQPKGPEGKDNF